MPESCMTLAVCGRYNTASRLLDADHVHECSICRYVQTWPFRLRICQWQSCAVACNPNQAPAPHSRTLNPVTCVLSVCTCVPARLSACAYVLMIMFVCTCTCADVHLQHPYVHRQCSREGAGITLTSKPRSLMTRSVTMLSFLPFLISAFMKASSSQSGV